MNPGRFSTSMACWVCGAVLAPLSFALAQLPEQSAEAVQIDDATVVQWFGYQGRSYFIQVSDESDPLRKWTWAPVIETGNDEDISHEFGGDTPRAFVRLQYTDAVPPAGVSLDDWDADGDGLSNIAEITAVPQTNPLSDDTDGDGLKDGWELANGLDATDNGSGNPNNGYLGDPDLDDSSNADEQAAGTSAASDQEHPPQLISVERRGIHYFNTPTGEKWTRYGPSWTESPPDEEAAAELTPTQLADALNQRFPFPATPPDEVQKSNASDASLSYAGDRSLSRDATSSALSVHLAQARYWLKVSPKDLEKAPLEFHYLKISKGSFAPLPSGSILNVAPTATLVTFKIDSDSVLSKPVDILPVVPLVEANGLVSVDTYLVPVGMTVDVNRDAKLDGADQGRVTEANPWRFWVNDDNDSGETGGSDTMDDFPDGADQQVDGIRDLVDFFPLHLELAKSLSYLPESDYQYFLKTRGDESWRGDYNVLWYPEAVVAGDPQDPDAAGAYLKNVARARELATRAVSFVTASGVQIPNEMLAAAKIGKGVALIECREPTELPLTVEIRKNDGTPVVEVPLPVKVSRVADMFRWIYVLPGAADLVAGDIPGDPPNWPDADRNGKHFVFVHQINLTNAFGTAKSFKQYLGLIEGETSVAAHSMGNILVGSAMHDWNARPKNYFMLDAAAAKECYDPTEANDSNQDKGMVHPAWKDYPKPLRASEWHDRAWTAGDQRSHLTWKGRLRGVVDNGGQTAVYNFFSSGEEVLNNPTDGEPNLNTLNPFDNGTLVWARPNKAWGMQEKRKGLGLTGYVETSNYGGWLPNWDPDDPDIHVIDNNGKRMRFPFELPQIPSSAYFDFLVSLKYRPFFDDTLHATLFGLDEGDGTPGSNYARDHRNTLISQMVPCTTFATGSNAFRNPATSLLPANRHFNMDDVMKTDPDEWPETDAHDEEENLPRAWLHSDIREKAFTHNWKVYREFVEQGHLN